MSPSPSKVSRWLKKKKKRNEKLEYLERISCIQCIFRIQTPVICISEALATWVLPQCVFYCVHWVIVTVDFKSLKVISWTKKSCWGQSKFNNTSCWIQKYKRIILLEYLAAVKCFNEQSLISTQLLKQIVLVNIHVCTASTSLLCSLFAPLSLFQVHFFSRDVAWSSWNDFVVQRCQALVSKEFSNASAHSWKMCSCNFSLAVLTRNPFCLFTSNALAPNPQQQMLLWGSSYRIHRKEEKCTFCLSTCSPPPL